MSFKKHTTSDVVAHTPTNITFHQYHRLYLFSEQNGLDYIIHFNNHRTYECNVVPKIWSQFLLMPFNPAPSSKESSSVKALPPPSLYIYEIITVRIHFTASDSPLLLLHYCQKLTAQTTSRLSSLPHYSPCMSGTVWPKALSILHWIHRQHRSYSIASQGFVHFTYRRNSNLLAAHMLESPSWKRKIR